MESAQPKPASDRPPSWLARFWSRMHRGDSVGWLICTLFQGLLTWGFIGLSQLSEGGGWEVHAKLLVLVAIIATWVMALRTIRARILELLRFWQTSRTKGTTDADTAAEGQQDARLRAHVGGSMWRLRIIAAGITMPFFVMPVFVSVLCVGLSLWKGEMNEQFLGMAMVLSMLAAIVGTYFHWAVVPLPSAANARRGIRVRLSKKESQESRDK